MIKLKPCPFCGYSFPKLEEKSKTFYKGEQVYNTYVRCPACDARGRRAILSHFPTNKKAREYVMEAWNRRSNDWISVKDRLPEEIHTINYYDFVSGETSFTESDMVLCRVIYNREIQYVTGLLTDGQWYLYHDTYNIETEELHVTHWMPLPEPPEVNENDEL